MKAFSILLIQILIISCSKCTNIQSSANKNKIHINTNVKQTVKFDQIPKPEYPSFSKKVKVQRIQKPQYPSFSKNKKINLEKSTQIMEFKQPFTPKNENFLECARRVLGQTAFASFLALISTGGVGSTSFLGGFGFTCNGIGAGSFAAWTQSFIGLAKAGSTFSKLQSLGALGGGIFGSAFFSVIVTAGGLTGFALLCSKCDCI